jgi:WD40 repeat protein/predicted Ser/Thr protein kinase
MATQNNCVKCGARLGEKTRQRFCAKCLILQAGVGLLDPAVDSEPEAGGEVGGQNSEGGGQQPEVSNQVMANPSPFTAGFSLLPESFGDYELLEEIGRGGMGVVYRARQRSLDRIVAIKMMAFGPGSSPELVKRFRAEAVSAAALQHPNIVAIHEVGIHEGRHFFVMDFVEGQSLAQIAKNELLTSKRAAAYLKTIAEAVHYAHERGILHRDLKPSNVLIDAQDQPRIVDFGLARRLDGASELTVTGQVLGSPNYLPAEQATARRGRVSRRTDVYALGATLYHLLTGRPPFQAESFSQTLDLVLHSEPVAPRLLNPSVPRDLETICLKCLENEPSRRYPTAEALADELERFLDSKPIHARPIGPVGKTWRWCRRKPQAASLGAAAILVFLLGLAGVLGMWLRAESQRQRAEAGELAARQRAYISEINAAQAALKANNPARALELLNRHLPPGKSEIRNPKSELDLRGFEWRYLWQQCQNDAAEIVGRLSGKIWSLGVSRDGRWLAAGSEQGEIKAWRLATGEEIKLLPDQGWPNYVTYSPDGSELVFTDQGSASSLSTIRAWNIKTGERRTLIVESEHAGVPLFSPDGKWLSYAKVDANLHRTAVVLDFPAQTTVKDMQALTPVTDNYHGGEIAFTADSRSLVFSENDPDRRIDLWDFDTGSKAQYFPAHAEAIVALAVNPDGHVLATGAGFTDCSIKFWGIPSFQPLGELLGHEGWITALAFSPDGRILASASADQTLRVWDVAAKSQKWASRRLPHAVSRVCFSPDGRTLFSGDNDGTIHRWSLDNLREQQTFRRQTSGLEKLAVAPSGERLAAIRQGVVWLGDAQTGQLTNSIPQLGSNNLSLRFSVDGRFLFAGSRDGDIRIWSLSAERLERRLRAEALPVTKLLQDRLGRSLAVAQSDVWTITPGGRPCPITIWNLAGWQERATRIVSGYRLACDISPDGKWLATGVPWQPVQVWNLKHTFETNPPSFSVGTVTDLAFSPDGLLLAASSEQGAVKVWQIPTLGEVADIRAHSREVNTLAFSPDSRRLVTAGDDQEAIKVWEVDTWQELLTLPLPGESIRQLAFSEDGDRLFAVNSRGDLLLWHLPSFAEIEAKEKGQRVQ